MNDRAPPMEEDHVVIEGQRQLWDAITLGNWDNVENILNSNITQEEKRDLIKYTDVREDDEESDTEDDDSHGGTDSDEETEVLNSFLYSLEKGAPLSIIKKIVDTVMIELKNDDNIQHYTNDNNNDDSGLNTLFPKGELDMAKAIQCACKCPSPSVDVIQFVAGVIMEVEGGAKAIVKLYPFFEETNIIHWICSNRSVTVPLVEVVARVMRSAEDGAEAIIKADEEGRTMMHCICENGSVTVELVEAGAQTMKSIVGGAEAIINMDYGGDNIMHVICENDSATVPLVEAVARIMMSVEGGAEAIIKTDCEDGNIMHLICSNDSVTAPLFKAVADIMMSVEGGAEAIFMGMPTGETCLDDLINNNNAASDETKLEVLVAAAPIAKKYNQDDSLKTFIIQAILERLPTPALGIIPALKMGLIWEYGFEDIIKQNADGLIIADETTGLYPFMVAALSTVPHPDLDTIYRILMTCPDVVTIIHPAYTKKVN